MAKTEETLIIEDVLYQNLFGSNPCLAREYYNYLVIPRELYLKQSLYEWKEQIPYYVGIIVVNVERRSKWVAKRPAPMEVSAGMKFMLRQSLIRTLFYQNDKLKKNSAAKIEQICQETEK